MIELSMSVIVVVVAAEKKDEALRSEVPGPLIGICRQG
jgi:hypothetical protein